MGKINKFSLLKKSLLACGILASVIWIGLDIFASTQLKNYSYLDQAPSELSAVSTSTQPLWNVMSFVFNPLWIAFGLGVMLAAGNKLSIRLAGIFLVAWGLTSFAWLLFPMHSRGEIGSVSDTGHLVMAAITVTLLVLIIIFGSGAKSRGFRVYSLLTIITMLVFGFLVGLQAPRVAQNLPTPLMGLMERVSVYSSMLWMAIFSLVLQRSKRTVET